MNINELASNGFVTFRIRPFSSLALGQQIRNFADIYFDFNEPVRTNTSLNTLFQPPLVQGLVGNVNIISASEALKNNVLRIDLFPNPSTGIFNINSNQSGQIRVVNLLGEQVETKKLAVGRQEMDLRNLKSGIYFLDIQTPAGKEMKKLILE